MVIDIGGNTGMVSIFLAKKFPFLKIYSFEPVKENFENFKKNLVLNNIPEGIIIVENVAVTKDARDVKLITNAENSGGSSIAEISDISMDIDIINYDVKSVTLNDIFSQYNIESCKLLKIDCEGSEYEILRNTSEENLLKCENLRAEFHENQSICQDGDNANKLIQFCKKYIKSVEVVICHKTI